MSLLLKDIVPQLFEKQTDWRVTLARQWSTVVGSLQTRIRLEKIYNDTVVIGVYESHWMQELYVLSSVLLDSINEFIGERKINHVRFKLVEEKQKAPKKGPLKKLVRPVEVRLTQGQQKALSGIVDEQLRHALTDFWGRCSAQEE